MANTTWIKWRVKQKVPYIWLVTKLFEMYKTRSIWYIRLVIVQYFIVSTYLSPPWIQYSLLCSTTILYINMWYPSKIDQETLTHKRKNAANDRYCSICNKCKLNFCFVMKCECHAKLRNRLFITRWIVPPSKYFALFHHIYAYTCLRMKMIKLQRACWHSFVSHFKLQVFNTTTQALSFNIIS